MTPEHFKQAMKIVAEANRIAALIRAESARHDAEMRALGEQLAAVRRSCPHAVVERDGDPAGGPPTHSCCVCGCEVGCGGGA